MNGAEAGWLNAEDLGAAAWRVVDIMLDKSYGHDKPRGLLRMVDRRYTDAGKRDDFLRTVGDGTLWIAFIAALAGNSSANLKDILQQSLALTAVFKCQELLAVANPAHLSALMRSLVIKNAEPAVTERAERVAGAVNGLLKALSDRWGDLYQAQGSGRRRQKGDSILWSNMWGWTFPPSSPAEIYKLGYINVETAAIDDEKIHAVITSLRLANENSLVSASDVRKAPENDLN